jgi:hypothetical protein
LRDIETFLAELADLRRMEQARLRSSLHLPRGFRVPRELSIAADHQWIVSPVMAQSFFAPREAYSGVPASDRPQLEYWAASLVDCNWALITGQESRALAFEVDTRSHSDSLLHLCGDDWGWQETLQFHAAHRCFALFHCDEPSICKFSAGPRLKLHYGAPILIPPSRIGSDTLHYLDPGAPFLDVPDWLLEYAAGPSQSYLVRA